MIATGGIFMSSADSFRYQIVTKFLNGLISRNEASVLLKLSERSNQSPRWKNQKKRHFRH